MSDNSRAYNSVWQLRGDAWRRLEEASDRLTKPTTSGELKDEYVTICRDLLATLTPLEPYWAYPGTPQFARVQRMFSAGSYDKFAHAVARINRALTTESYRTGDVEHAGLDENDMFPSDPRELANQPVTQREQPYFEVLVVESMTEAQRTCAAFSGHWRRLSFISKARRTILMSAYVDMRPCERTLLPPSQVVRATEELICDASIRSQGRLGL